MGICLGFENLVGYTASVGFDAVDWIWAKNESLPLQFTVDPWDTTFYEPIDALKLAN